MGWEAALLGDEELPGKANLRAHFSKTEETKDSSKSPGSVGESRGKLKGRDGSGLENGRKAGEPVRGVVRQGRGGEETGRLVRPGKGVIGKTRGRE